MKVRYLGPFESVWIAATDQTVEQGKIVDVPAEVGRSLVKQDVWKQVATPKKEKKES